MPIAKKNIMWYNLLINTLGLLKIWIGPDRRKNEDISYTNNNRSNCNNNLNYFDRKNKQSSIQISQIAKNPPTEEKQKISENIQSNLPIKGFYQPKWLFSYNEKEAYRQLKTTTEKYNLSLFAKVRLLDLVEPIKNNPKYKTYFYKIQAKHVDFVICNEKLVAKLIIELDDSSHDAKDRLERDKFVDEVLTSTGYRVIHI